MMTMSSVDEGFFLGPMPGQFESLEDWRYEMHESNIGRIVSLALPDEIADESLEYAEWLEKQTEFQVVEVPIPDGGVPTDSGVIDFWTAAYETDELLNRDNGAVFVHCKAGVGRTGMFSIAVLMCGGCTFQEASNRVATVDAGPENPRQTEFVADGPPDEMVYIRTTCGFDWTLKQKRHARSVLASADPAAFLVNLAGPPSKGCRLKHADRRRGYVKLQDALDNRWRIHDAATDELISEHPDVEGIIRAGWKIDT